jgi:sodium pump decarboxylase gamma subunit
MILDKLQEGVIVTVFAMGIVFVVLIVLMYIIMFQTKLLGNISKDKSSSSKTPQKDIVKPAEAPKELITKKIAAVVPKSNDKEIAAAIIAAICEYTNLSSSDFTIKSIKRVSGNDSAWRKNSNF